MNSMTAQSEMNSIIEEVLINGDLSELKPEQRVAYYNKVCETVGLNPMTKPFDYIKLNGKLVLYAAKNCAEQLRAIKNVSLEIVSRQEIGDVYVVTAEATLPDGRKDAATGAVPTAHLKGEALANAMMKAETKAKRRVTLSICSLGMLDAVEVDSIPTHQKAQPAFQTKTVTVETKTDPLSVIPHEQPKAPLGIVTGTGAPAKKVITPTTITSSSTPVADKFMEDIKGKTMPQIYEKMGPDRLMNYISDLETEAAFSGVPLSKEIESFIKKAEEYLGRMENRPFDFQEPGSLG